jgi:hypothetical protein
MLRGNLSSRPFYNERLVTLAFAVVAIGVVALTAFNATRLVALSSQRSALSTRIDTNEVEAARIRAGADALQKSVDRSTLGALAGSTQEANDLIDQRTFSWTTFFSLIEKTMPFDVRLVAVSPRVERGVFKVTMIVVARRFENVQDFVDALIGTGSFYDVIPTSDNVKEDGTFNVTIEASYVAPGAAAPRKPDATGGRGR